MKPNIIIRIIDALLRHYGYGVFRVSDVEAERIKREQVEKENNAMLARLTTVAMAGRR